MGSKSYAKYIEESGALAGADGYIVVRGFLAYNAPTMNPPEMVELEPSYNAVSPPTSNPFLTLVALRNQPLL